MPYFDPDEFIELLVKYHDGQASRQEVQFIEQQLEENELARILWQDVLQTFSEENTPNNPAPEQVRKRPLSYWLAASAAVLLILIVVGDSIYLSLHKRQPTLPRANYEKAIVLQFADGHILQLGKRAADSFPPPAKMPLNRMESKFAKEPNILTVPRGLTYAVKLPDSTIVYINAATDLKFPFVFHPNRREVFVEGEAYFEVAPDPGRPFVVHTKQADVIALGTSFNVSTYDNHFETSLLTGAVVVMEKNKMIQLSPGQSAIRNSKTGELAVDTFIKDSLPGWVNGRYVFKQKTLAEVCSTIERLYDVEIVFDRTEIKRLRYTGAVARKEPIQVFLDNLAKSSQIKYYFDKQKRVHLK
jgi:ferric-dicitrate binding protein FerR (iron transport regulator)